MESHQHQLSLATHCLATLDISESQESSTAPSTKYPPGSGHACHSAGVQQGESTQYDASEDTESKNISDVIFQKLDKTTSSLAALEISDNVDGKKLQSTELTTTSIENALNSLSKSTQELKLTECEKPSSKSKPRVSKMMRESRHNSHLDPYIVAIANNVMRRARQRKLNPCRCGMCRTCRSSYVFIHHPPPFVHRPFNHTYTRRILNPFINYNYL